MRYVKALLSGQVEELEGVWRAGRCHRERQRAHAVLLSAKGYSLDECADILGVDRDAVSRWLSRWEAQGVAGLSEGPRPGRPPALGPAEREALAAAAALNPTSPRAELAKKGG